MYYRYSSKKKIGGYYKFILFLLIVSALVYMAYKYSDLLMFWKYDLSKINKEIVEINNEKTISGRSRLIQEALVSCKKYKNENVNSSEAHYIYGKLNYMMAELYFDKNFTKKIINTDENKIDKNVLNYFYQSIKSIKKGIALDRGDSPEDEVLLVLLKSLYFTRYYDTLSLMELLNKVREPEKLLSNDSKRLYGYLKILSGFEDAGLEFITKNGNVDGTVEGRMFLASSFTLAKHYSRALVEYQKLLIALPDNSGKKSIHKKIGDIYSQQSLYEEAVKSYLEAYSYDKKDIALLKKIADIYHNNGKKRLAKQYRQMVQRSGRSNPTKRGIR